MSKVKWVEAELLPFGFSEPIENDGLGRAARLTARGESRAGGAFLVVNDRHEG